MAVSTKEIRERIDAALLNRLADYSTLRNEIYALVECVEALVPALAVYANEEHWSNLHDDEADPLWFDADKLDGAPCYRGWKIAAHALGSVGLAELDEDGKLVEVPGLAAEVK